MASLAVAELASSDTCLAIGAEIEEKYSRRRRSERVAVVIVAAISTEWQVLGDQPKPYPFPAQGNHLGLDLYKGHQCQFELGSYCERKKLAPESGRS